MAKRAKLKQKKKAKKPPVVRAKKPPTAQRVTTEKVPSPWNNGFDKIERVIDTIRAMRNRKQIDERQFDAAERFKYAYQASHGNIKSALNVTEGGHGAPGPRVPPRHIIENMDVIDQVKTRLGAIDFYIVVLIAGQGHTVEYVTKLMCPPGPNGKCKDDDLRSTGKRFRDALTSLVYLWYGNDKRLARFFVPEWARPDQVVTGEVPKATAAHVSRDRLGKVSVKR